MNSPVSPKLLNQKISSSACRTNIFSASEVRFWPELGYQIDLQMAPAVILSQINQIGTKYTVSALTDSSNNSKKLEIHQRTESHIFPNHLAGANGCTDEIA